MNCTNPEDQVHCTKCDHTFVCGNAPHDILGPLCPNCGSIEVESHEEEHTMDSKNIQLTKEEEAYIRSKASGCAHCMGEESLIDDVGPKGAGLTNTWHCAWCLASCSCEADHDCWEELGLPDPETFPPGQVDDICASLNAKGLGAWA